MNTERKASESTSSKSSSLLPLLTMLLCLASLATVSEGFSLTEPKWPYEGVNPYNLPNNSTEMSKLLRLAVGGAATGDQIRRWMETFVTLADFDILQNFVFYQIGYDISLDLSYLTLPGRGEAFIAIETFMDNETVMHYDNITQLPAFVQPFVFGYNVPGFLNYVTYRPTESIVLTVEVLADIYMGTITNWNNTAIRELNEPFLAQLPNATIVPLGYLNRDPSTIYVTQTFWNLAPRFREAFPEGPFAEWPTPGSPNVSASLQLYNNVFTPVSSMYNVPGMIGYVSLPILNSGSGQMSPYALIKHQGAVYYPNDEATVMAMYRDVELGDYNIVNGINYTADGYPFSAITYLFFCQGTESTVDICPKDRGTLKFFHWVLTEKQPRDQASFNGFYYLPDQIIEPVVEQVLGFQCFEEGSLLQIQVVDDHDGAYFPALLAVGLSLGFFMVALGLFLTFYKESKNAKKKFILILYNLCLLAGASLMLISMVFFFIVPDQDWVCQLRIWLLALGLSMLLGSMFTRTMQMHRMYAFARRADDADGKLSSGGVDVEAIKKLKNNTVRDFVLGYVGITTLQIVILICWTAIDTFEARLSVISDIDLTSSWVCNCDNVWIWLGIEIGFFVCLLFYGMIVTYLTWDTRNKYKFAEARWLLMIIYNMVIVVAAGLPIVLTIDIKDKQVFIIASVFISFCVITTLFLFYIPKIGGRMEKWVFKFRKAFFSSQGASKETDNTYTNSTTNTRSTVTKSKQHTNSSSNNSRV